MGNEEGTDRGQAYFSFDGGGAGYQDRIDRRPQEGWWFVGSQDKFWATLLGKTGTPGTECGSAGPGLALEG